MKNDRLSNLVVLILGSILLSFPLGKLYDSLVSGGEGYIVIDPNNLFSGFLMALAFLAALLASLKRKWALLIVNLIVILFAIWWEIPDDLRFDLIATVLGLMVGYLARLVLKSRQPDNL